MADTPGQNGIVRASRRLPRRIETSIMIHPAYSRQLRGYSAAICWNWELNHCLHEEDATMPRVGRSEGSVVSPMPGCNVLDMVKDCQEREKGEQEWPRPTGASARALPSGVPWVPRGKKEGCCESSTISLGKPDDAKVSSGWTGEKAEGYMTSRWARGDLLTPHVPRLPARHGSWRV